MSINDALYEGKLVSFSSLDPEKDPAVEASWMQDPEYLQMVGIETARPLSPSQIKKKMEKIEKEQEETRSLFHFAIRAREDDRLVGFARLAWVTWNTGAGWVTLGIGSPQDRRRGFGTEALALLTQFAFQELDLHRLNAAVQEYNLPALRLFEKAGFTKEVTRRKALERGGRTWDLYILGLLKREWEAVFKQGGANHAR